MEVLGAVASVAGILSLAVQGIQAANSLRDLYSECTDEAAREFFHELNASAELLHDVQTLCLRLQQENGAGGSQIRLRSLEIQVEDCTLDLEQWLTTAKRIDARQRNLGRLTGTTPPKRQFAKLLQTVLKAKTMIATKQARQMVCNRFRTHQQNVRTAFAIISTELHITQAHRLEEVGMLLADSINNSASRDRKESQILSNLQSSGSSILALSMSHDERLRDIQSLWSDLSDKVDRLTSALSLGGSQTSSHSITHSASIAEPAAPSQHRDSNVEQPVHIDDATIVMDFEKTLDLEEDDANEGSEDEVDAWIDEKVLDKIHVDIHLIVNQYFDTIVAEYVMAARQWQSMRTRGSLLHLLEHAPRANQIIFDANLPVDVSGCAARLLSLRRQALNDSLDKSLQEADLLFGIDIDSVRQWETAAANDVPEAGRVLALPDEMGSSTMRMKESWARINEWLLQQMNSTLYLAGLHRQIVRHCCPELHYRNIAVQDGLLQRYIIKYWFLDEAGLSNVEDKYAESLSMNSENTVLPVAFDVGELGEGESVGYGPQSIEGIPMTQVLLLQPEYPPIQASTIDVEDARGIFECASLPEGTSPAARSRAIQALEAYSEEAVAQLGSAESIE